MNNENNNKLKVVIQELQKYKAKLASIVDTIEDIVYRVDSNGNITFINEAIKKYGYEPVELIGKSMIDLVHPADRERAKFIVNERRTGKRKTGNFQIRLLTKNSGTLAFELRTELLDVNSKFVTISSEGIYLDDQTSDDQQFYGSQGIARDVSSKVSTELKLTESKEKFLTILDELDDGYYEIDLDGKIKMANRALSNITGYFFDELIGLNYTDLFELKELGMITSVFTDVSQTGVSAKLEEWVILKSSKKKKYVEFSISSIKDEDNKVSGFRGLIRDITEKEKLEQELIRARKFEAVGILAGGIAHDYNNALTAILGNISLAKMELSDSNSDVMEMLNDAEEASLKIKNLTQRLSSFGKGGRPVKRTTDLKKIISENIESVLKDYDGNYIIDCDNDLKTIEIDEIQIIQVLLHLIENAIESMNDEGIIKFSVKNVEIFQEKVHHEISLQPGEYVLISVEDNGCGINEDDKYQIFDPYFTTKTFHNGMGLAVCYAVIKRHNGFIDFISDENGSKFLVYLQV